MKRSRILLLISRVLARFPVRDQLMCLGVNYTVDNIFWAIAGLEVMSHRSGLFPRKHPGYIATLIN
jgi:hypothetical protein